MPPSRWIYKKPIKCEFLSAISSHWLTARKLILFVQSIYMICHAEKFLLSLIPKSGQQMHPNWVVFRIIQSCSGREHTYNSRIMTFNTMLEPIRMIPLLVNQFQVMLKNNAFLFLSLPSSQNHFLTSAKGL